MAEQPRIYVEPPVPVSTGFQTVDQIRSVLSQHRWGRFRMSALLVEAMLENSRFRAAINTRMAGLVATEVKFEPARENKDARRAAREYAEDWPAMMPAPIRKQRAVWALLLGVGFSQRALELSPVGGRQIFKIRPYWPGFASWLWAEGGYRIQT